MTTRLRVTHKKTVAQLHALDNATVQQFSRPALLPPEWEAAWVAQHPKEPRHSRDIPVTLLPPEFEVWWRMFCKNSPKYQERLRFDIARDPRSLLMALVAGLKVGGIAGAQPARRAAGIIGIRREDLDDLAGALWAKAEAGSFADELVAQAFYTCFPDCNPRNIYRKPMGPLMAHEWGAVRTWKDEELLSPPHELKQSTGNEADINKVKTRYNIIVDAVESHDSYPLQDLGHLPEFEFDAATTEEPE